MSQSNTRVGDIRVLAGEALTGMEGRLVKLTHDTGVPEVKLPAAITDYALYAVIEGAADAALVSVRPVEAGRVKPFRTSTWRRIRRLWVQHPPKREAGILWPVPAWAAAP